MLHVGMVVLLSRIYERCDNSRQNEEINDGSNKVPSAQ